MATYGQLSGQQRDAINRALPRLYKFALVLTANEELARALLRGTCKALLSARQGWREEDPGRLTGAFKRMYALWASKMAYDPEVQRKYSPQPQLFAGAIKKGALAANSQLAKFIAELQAPQRSVLYLVYGEGASYEEAAEIAQLNMLALMKLLARGHLSLTEWLERRGLQEEGTHRDTGPHYGREQAA